MADNNILIENQSGFRSGHSTITAAMLVTNYIINALDRKQHCAVDLFVDLSKAFDSVDHELLLGRLSDIGMCDMAIEWFRNYLADRTQCVYTDGHKSSFMEITKEVRQGSILPPVFFCLIFINNIGNDMLTAKVHLYADDTIVYSVALSQAVSELQTAFQQL